jgi:urease accessory protein
MYEFIAKAQDSPLLPLTSLTLPYGLRQKSRQRVKLDNGEDAAIYLARGSLLYHGDLLVTEQDILIRVLAADELLSVAHCHDPLLFARACYHLGNRHIPLQIGTNRLAYLHDHVLDAMLHGLGLAVAHHTAPFEPEPGAYGAQAGHGHAH